MKKLIYKSIEKALKENKFYTVGFKEDKYPLPEIPIFSSKNSKDFLHKRIRSNKKIRKLNYDVAQNVTVDIMLYTSNNIGYSINCIFIEYKNCLCNLGNLMKNDLYTKTRNTFFSKDSIESIIRILNKYGYHE